jgi:hypothetical protein
MHHICITGELYPAPQWAEAFAGAARALQLGGMVLLFAGDMLFNTLHLPKPFFYNWIAVCILHLHSQYCHITV